MNPANDFRARQAWYRDAVSSMQEALARDDETAFSATLTALQLDREGSLQISVRHVAENLGRALEQFRADSRLARMAGREVPDARARLAHVIDLTDKAAHRTMDLIDQCGELAEGARRKLSAVPVAAAHADLEMQIDGMRAKLAEMLVAQGYQDLSGQIIRGVMKLIDELEVALRDLLLISGTDPEIGPAVESDPRELSGPVVPGVSSGNAVDGQTDVDALLSGMGL